jgi:hypothetical protein
MIHFENSQLTESYQAVSVHVANTCDRKKLIFQSNFYLASYKHIISFFFTISNIPAVKYIKI